MRFDDVRFAPDYWVVLVMIDFRPALAATLRNRKLEFNRLRRGRRINEKVSLDLIGRIEAITRFDCFCREVVSPFRAGWKIAFHSYALGKDTAGRAAAEVCRFLLGCGEPFECNVSKFNAAEVVGKLEVRS